MRQRRLKAPASFPVAHYHCMSRVVNRDFVFGPQERGKVSLPEYLQLRVRYFADGAVLGTREYVDGVFHALRERWGSRRTDGARPRQGLAGDLCVLRDLRQQVFG